jgi:predicted DNA-binding antitoxin AbrB/MazE fold protein
MAEVITAVYEKGVLRPLTPLALAEKQTVRIQILTESETGPMIQDLIARGLLTPPPGMPGMPPITAEERHNLADRLGRVGGHSLSELIIAEREGR